MQVHTNQREYEEQAARQMAYMRKIYHFSKTKVAAYLGMSRQGYTALENNERSIRLDMLMELTGLYQCSLDELLTEEKEDHE